jgi:hypothetical protein
LKVIEVGVLFVGKECHVTVLDDVAVRAGAALNVVNDLLQHGKGGPFVAVRRCPMFRLKK